MHKKKAVQNSHGYYIPRDCIRGIQEFYSLDRKFKVQTTHSENKTNSFRILCCLHFSIFVHKFYSSYLTEEDACRDRISLAYSNSIPASLLYSHCSIPDYLDFWTPWFTFGKLSELGLLL